MTDLPDTPAGRIHTPDPAAVERLHALLGHDQRRAAKAAQTRANYGGVLENLVRRSAVIAAARTRHLTADELAEIDRRRAEGQSWAAIAKHLGIAHSTLARAIERSKPR